MSEADLLFLTVAARGEWPARRLAMAAVTGDPAGDARPGVVWLGGFRSDMQSSKALALAAWAERAGRAFLRFDYSGHGRSDGAFEAGTIGLWLDDALAVLREATRGPQILVGSSMGAWIALLAIRALATAGEADRVAGSVLIAPAIDFTERLMWDRFTPAIRAELAANGVWLRPSPYGDPTPVTSRLIEEGRRHLMLDTRIDAHGPVHILQGMQDEDVPWTHAMTLVEHFAQDPVSIMLIRDGDHRLSREEDIGRLIAAVGGIA